MAAHKLIRISYLLAFALAVVAALAPAQHSAAQEVDIMVQQSSGKLVTGVAELFSNTFTIPQRVYTRNLLSNYRAADPGFFALSEGNPLLPAEALPANTDLLWDFLPMTVGHTVSNLLYWDGTDADANGLDLDDVAFVRPDNAAFKVINNGTFTADASDQLVTGGLVDTTEFDGSIHKHPAYRVETLDATNPLEGVYLVSQQVRMAGLETSDPYFLAFRTSTIGNDVLGLAADWIEANIEMLTSPPVLEGDYNGDGFVDLGDYTSWRDTLGSTTELMANGDDSGASQGLVDQADYAVWKNNFGNALASPMSTAASTMIPEPASIVTLVASMAALAWRRSSTSSNFAPAEVG